MKLLQVVGTVLAGLVLGAWACGGETSSPSDRDAGADAFASADGAPATSDGAAPPTCEKSACARVSCAALGPECASPGTCAQAKICEEAFFGEADGAASTGGGTLKYTTNGPDTEANARCVLEALRDGNIGRVSWGFSGGVHSYGETIDVVSGRRAFGTFSESVDSPSTKGGYANVPLKPAAFFDDCLAKNDVDAYAKCLKDMFEEC